MRRNVLVALVMVAHLIVLLVVTVFATGMATADEGPVSGTVKSVDAGAQTLTVESTAKGKTRQVVVHLKPGGKVVRFTRPTEPGTTGFVEQTVALADVKPGWVVSAVTSHEGEKEVAEVVKVVLER